MNMKNEAGPDLAGAEAVYVAMIARELTTTGLPSHWVGVYLQHKPIYQALEACFGITDPETLTCVYDVLCAIGTREANTLARSIDSDDREGETQ